MEDIRNDDALPEGEEPQSPEGQTSQENHTDDMAVEASPPATCQTRQDGKSDAGADAPEPDLNGQQEPHKKKSKPGRDSPFDPFWDTEILPQLEYDLAAEITPAGILDFLWKKHPEAFEGRERNYLLDTLRRRIKKWRKDHRRGLPPRRKPCPRTQGSARRKRRLMTFPQKHPPGREVQVDFTDCKKLEVTIQGKPFPHELFNFRMSHSGWIYVEVFRGETVSALMQGLQNAMRELGGAPQVVRSDNRRNVIQNKQPVQPYGAFLQHYGLELSLINHGRPQENGGVEGENGRVKEDIRQALLIRRSRNFDSAEDYAALVRQVVDHRNRRPKVQHRLSAERASLRPLPETEAPEHIAMQLKVNDLSVINVYSCRYSVPCRAVDQEVSVRLYAEHLEVYDATGRHLATWTRRHGNDLWIICPCHCFPDLMIKWGGFAGLPDAYKEQLFPRPSFRRTHEKLLEWDPNGIKANGLNADYQYVRILHLACKGDQMQAVDQALETLLKLGDPFDFEDVRRLVAPSPQASQDSATERFDPPDQSDEPPSQIPFL